MSNESAPVVVPAKPVEIENNTERFLIMFPTESYDQGMRLQPGLNRVPRQYWDEFLSHCVETEARPGKPSRKRYPGRELLEDWQKPVILHLKDGSRRGPMITVYDAEQVGREEGPELPESLDGFARAAWEKIIQGTANKQALERWTKSSTKAIAAAARDRLVLLKGGA